VKPFVIWLAGIALVFGIFAVVTNLVRETDRFFVVVDSSFAMTDVWNQVSAELDDLDNERYSEFALATEKDLVHTWSASLSLSGITPFAPCGFERVEAYPQFAEADRLVLITTPSSCDTASLTGDWTVIELEP
jgi:hypothetical protein